MHTFNDPAITVRYVDDAGNVLDRIPERKGFATVMPPPEILRPLESVTDSLWPRAPVIPIMDTGASDSIYTMAAGIPSYGISGIAIDQDDIRAHGKDERVRASCLTMGADFITAI